MKPERHVSHCASAEKGHCLHPVYGWEVTQVIEPGPGALRTVEPDGPSHPSCRGANDGQCGSSLNWTRLATLERAQAKRGLTVERGDDRPYGAVARVRHWPCGAAAISSIASELEPEAQSKVAPNSPGLTKSQFGDEAAGN